MGERVNGLGRTVLSQRTAQGVGLVLVLLGGLVTAGAAQQPDLGPNASLNDRQVFPATDPWNQAIDRAPVDPSSDTLIDSIGRQTHLHPDFGANYNGGPFGIPYIGVPGNTPKVRISFQYAD